MDPKLREFILDQAIAWGKSVQGLENPIAAIDDTKPAEVYGENVLAWHARISADDGSCPIIVEVTIDPDGYVGVGLVANPPES